MNNYIVYFEFLGKKMKKSVQADCVADAEEIVRDLIIIHHVKREPFDDTLEFLKSIFKM